MYLPLTNPSKRCITLRHTSMIFHHSPMSLQVSLIGSRSPPSEVHLPHTHPVSPQPSPSHHTSLGGRDGLPGRFPERTLHLPGADVHQAPVHRGHQQRQLADHAQQRQVHRVLQQRSTGYTRAPSQRRSGRRRTGRNRSKPDARRSRRGDGDVTAT